MAIQITRIDPMAGIPNSHEPGVLSVEKFDHWTDAFDSLRGRGVLLTPEHESEFMAHPETQFQRMEFINAGHAAYMCNVNYDVRGAEIDLNLVSHGQFSGAILSVADGVATQRVSRQGDTVQHDASKLSAPVAVGDVVDVQYRDGVGVVGGLERGAGVGR